jgi:hypothetical protein
MEPSDYEALLFVPRCWPEKTPMRRFTLTLLAWVFAASSCLGMSGTWRCANGTACAFTPGIGYHCPNVKSARHAPPAAAQSARSCCGHCRSQARGHVTVTGSGPCSAVCQACQCRFVVTSSRTPATTSYVSVLTASTMMDHSAVTSSRPTPVIGFLTRSVIFTTGPPGPFSFDPLSTTPSRAPPRLLSA